MKKIARILVCLLVIVTTLTAAHAEGVELAAQMMELDSFAHYPSYAHDAQTGKWSLQSYQADALLDRFWSYGIRNSSETIVFHLAAEGDARTGVWTPVLRFYDIDGSAINARAVSLLMDGVRYELAASSAQVQNGRYRAECISVPLAEDGLAMVEKLMAADSVTVRLHGDRMHTTAITSEASASRALLEAASLALLEGDYALITELGAKQYGLWDLSAIAWENEHGYRPALQQSAVIQLLGEAEVDDEMGMVLPDESGEAVQAAQQALIDSGFLSGTPARTFDDSAVEAVLRAQKYLGRIPTGCFDQALMEALAQGRTESPREEVPMHGLGQTAQVVLHRYWFADSVSASKNIESRRSVANTDHVLLAADGLICNRSARDLHLFMDVEASVVYNGQYAYEAELVCESSGGVELDSRLLPLAQARLIVYAEIPETLATDAQAQWSIVLSADGENLAIELQ